MRKRTLGSALVWALSAVCAGAQETYIARPDLQVPAPVFLTRPVEGRIEITNLPSVQEVRITGGTVEGPLEIRGDVGLRAGAPLPVEVTNLPELPDRVAVDGTVRLDDSQLLRVTVENFPRPEQKPEHQFAAYSFRGAFSAKDARAQRSFQPPQGTVFHVTDVVVDARSDSALKIRLTAPATAVRGLFAGADQEPISLAIVETRSGPHERFGTPVPIGGEFTLEVEAEGPGQGAPFQVVASGYLLPMR